MGDWHRAVAYLKPKIADDDPEPCMTLEFGDSPVLREFGCGLLILYVVDDGDSFSYVQNRHLASGEVTTETLHRVGWTTCEQSLNRGWRCAPAGRSMPSWETATSKPAGTR